MQVILKEKIKKLGEIGDKVSVKSGYARNYLLLNDKALRCTQENIRMFEEKKAERRKEKHGKQCHLPLIF